MGLRALHAVFPFLHDWAIAYNGLRVCLKCGRISRWVK